MFADYDKYNAAVAAFREQLRLSRYFERRLCIYLPAVLMARIATWFDRAADGLAQQESSP